MRRDEPHMAEILKHYWRPSPQLAESLVRGLEKGVNIALQTREKTIDNALLRSLTEQGFDARARRQILASRKSEDDIRVCAGDDNLSIEIENYGNRLEFDILKMMSFAETVPENHRGWGCLIVPANKRLGNPFISGSGQESIWNYSDQTTSPYDFAYSRATNFKHISVGL